MSFLPEAYSSVAADIYGVFYLIFYIVGIWFVVTLGALFYGVFTSLKKQGGKAQYITGDDWAQSKWIWIPLILVFMCDLLIDVKTANVWTKVEIAEKMPQNDYDVKIVGRQFQWEFTYPGPDGKLFTEDDIQIADGNDGELVLPVGKITKLHLTAADVLHSFFVREFGFKQDVIPGRILTRWVEPIKEGRIELTCAEICGPNHGTMRNWVKVVSQEEFNSFIKNLNSGKKVAMATK
ncbi:MAG: cytochrome C oxidase subunit II [Spirochaetia bacterium]|nr:cytochrome C oxidase subunit II [Spirochaetia bacterium]